MKRLLLLLFLLALQLSAIAETRYALIIGISGYPKFSENKKLKYSGTDAEAFASFIETPPGGAFQPQNVHLLTNEKATRENILHELKWVDNDIGADDVLYVFFAGHGLVQDNGERYFMPYDAAPSLPEDRGIPMKDFYKRVTLDTHAKQVIVFIDACHSAGADAARGDSNENGKDPWDDMNKKLGQVTMGFFSSSSNEESYEDDSFKQGLFTHYLLDGLRGAAKSTPDGYINAQDLYAYVDNAVYVRSSSNFPDHQTPQKSQEFNPTYILAAVTKPALTSGDAIAHYNAALKLAKGEKWNAAIPEFKEAIRIKSDYAEAHKDLAAALIATANWSEAFDELKRAQSLRPDLPGLMSLFSTAYYNYGLSLAKDQQYDNAIAQYQQAMQYWPDSPELYKAWGDALDNKKNTPEAIAKYTLAYTLNPNLPGIVDKLTLIHVRYANELTITGKYDQASSEFRSALEYEPNATYMVFPMKYIEKRSGNLSFFKYNDLSKYKPARAYIYDLWGSDLYLKGDYEGASDQFKTGLSFDPGNDDLHIHLGWAFEKLGNKAAALEQYRAAQALNTKDPDVPKNIERLSRELTPKPTP